MPSTLLLGRTDIGELLTVDDCLAAVEPAFRAHVAGQTLPPAILGVPATDGGFHVRHGTALQDVAAAVAAYEKAVRLGRGETMDLGR